MNQTTINADSTNQKIKQFNKKSILLIVFFYAICLFINHLLAIPPYYMQAFLPQFGLSIVLLVHYGIKAWPIIVCAEMIAQYHKAIYLYNLSFPTISLIHHGGLQIICLIVQIAISAQYFKYHLKGIENSKNPFKQLMLITLIHILLISLIYPFSLLFFNLLFNPLQIDTNQSYFYHTLIHWISINSGLILCAPIFSGSFQERRYLKRQNKNIETHAKQQAEDYKDEIMHFFLKDTPVAIAMLDNAYQYTMLSEQWIKDHQYYDKLPKIGEKINLFKAITDDIKNTQIKKTKHFGSCMFHQPNGVNTWFKWSTIPWKNRDNEVGGVIIFTEDLTNSKLIEKYEKIIFNITELMANRLTIKEFLNDSMIIICSTLEWDFSGLWKIEKNEEYLENVMHWTNQPMKMKDFTEATQKTTFKMGIGLPGRVWKEEKPAWIKDVTKDKNFPRAPYAKKAGLHGGFAFPVLIEGKIICIIECFSHHIQEPDQELLTTIRYIGIQLGQFIKRKEQQIQLAANEKFQKAILNSVTNGIFTVNKSGEIESSNQHLKKIFEMPDNSHKTPIQISDFIPEFQTAIRKIENRDTLEHEVRFIHKSGEEHIADLSLSKLNLDEKELLVGTLRDITEKKELEKIKNELISIVNHEIRTPLTSIYGSLGIISTHAQNDIPEKYLNLIVIAKKNCDRLIRLINDMLDIEKMASGKMAVFIEDIPLHKNIEEIIKQNESYGKKQQIAIRFKQKESDYLIQADPDRFNQVLTNLISNAIKFSNENSFIEIKTQKMDAYAIIQIIDFGLGIPQSFHDKIFQPFSQSDSSSVRKIGGTGLGLSICKSLIELMNGSISFESTEGKGTTFSICLPLS